MPNKVFDNTLMKQPQVSVDMKTTQKRLTYKKYLEKECKISYNVCIRVVKQNLDNIKSQFKSQGEK